MLKKIRVLNRIINTGIVAVVRGNSAEEALKTVDALLEGGIDIIEITMTVPGALNVMETLIGAFNNNEILLGAGTVLDSETARAASLTGAEFIVSPGLSSDVVKLCNRYQILNMAGCMTVTEMIAALEAGTDIIKLFPGNVFGPEAVKSFKGPLPQAEFIPTGGVDIDNVSRWLECGSLAVGVGGELTKGARDGNYKLVEKTARLFLDKIKSN